MQSAMLPCTMCRGQKRAPEGNDGVIKYWWILPFLSFFFSLNNQSFWIDECCTALCAMQQGMEGCWKKICEIGGSDAQMAFYYYLLFLWHHLTGAESEWMLRLFNIFWVFLSSWFFRKEPKALVILLISPFFVYYSNELRPYMLQIAASCAVSMLFWQVSRGEPVKFHVFFGSLFFLCLTSLTGVVWALGFAAAFMVMAFRQFGGRRFRRALLWWIFPFSGLGAYYLYTLFLGARAVSISSSWIVNACASMYELSGLAGMGPSRLELRMCMTPDALWNMNGLGAGMISGAILLAGSACGIILWNKRAERPLVPALLVLILLPGAVFLYGTEMMDFRFSGRHCAPLLPVLCLAWSLVASWDWSFPRIAQTILFLLMMIVWAVSDIRIRCNVLYGREDFRSAVSYCKLLQSSHVDILLLCNGAGKEFYGWIPGPLKDKWSDYKVIVVSRPSDYAAFLQYIESSGKYERSELCRGFVVYRRGGISQREGY